MEAGFKQCLMPSSILRVDISDTLMYVYEMLGAELLSNLYDKLGRLLTSSEESYSWQVLPKPDSLSLPRPVTPSSSAKPVAPSFPSTQRPCSMASSPSQRPLTSTIQMWCPGSLALSHGSASATCSWRILSCSPLVRSGTYPGAHSQNHSHPSQATGSLLGPIQNGRDTHVHKYSQHCSH